jgi:hypothetical protein
MAYSYRLQAISHDGTKSDFAYDTVNLNQSNCCSNSSSKVSYTSNGTRGEEIWFRILPV